MIQSRTNFGTLLSPFVDCLWYANGEAVSHQKERLLPTGSLDIIFKLRKDRTVRIFDDDNRGASQAVGGAVVSGTYTRPFALDKREPSPTVGVHFRPGGAAPFLGIPLSELMNRHVPLEEFWGQRAELVRERLMDASSVPSLFDVLEQALLEQLTEPPQEYAPMMKVVEAFSRTSTVNMKTVSESMGYRTKRFIRLFHDWVGVTPKMFCRIQRFQSVLDRIVGGKHPEWVHVALDSGYYDQSHLIRDFRAFAGVTPLSYQLIETNHKNHLALNS